MDGEKKIVPVPPNQDTINILFKEDIQSEEAMEAWLNQSRPDLGGRSPQNGEEMSLSRVGKHLYEKVSNCNTYALTPILYHLRNHWETCFFVVNQGC